MVKFSTSLDDICDKIKAIDPIAYSKTRNFSDGALTYLSPYISRGVISTKQVMNHVLSLDLQPYQTNKLLQELAWRDYWQQIWNNKGNEIDHDLKREQPDVANHEMPKIILDGDTGIVAVDKAIDQFYQTGYLHNHMRMYIAALSCNTGKSHWLLPAQWMYYHLLDGDWASNALSWQWVAGANSGKKYVANQENINKYFFTQQQNTILDVPYDKLENMAIPETMKTLESPILRTTMPPTDALEIDETLPTCVYNTYNLDPEWRKDTPSNRILLLEPSHFDKYPISDKVMDFISALAENIDLLQIFVGSFEDLQKQTAPTEIFYKQHPTARHYQGRQDDRDWMFVVKGYYPSFFNFWKKCKKELPAP